MELKEYLQIFREQRKIFIITIVVILIGSFAYFNFKPISYSTSLTLNITRSGVQQTADYRYDDFYRLQADEKFAETVVEWLNSPRIVTDIYTRAGIDVGDFNLRQLGKAFKSEKLSAQIVAVSFGTRSESDARKISDAISEIIQWNTQVLNENQKEDTWFAIVAQNPIVIRDNVSNLIVLLASLALGAFIGFWIVLGRHYLK